VRFNCRDPRSQSLVATASGLRVRPILTVLAMSCSIAIVFLFFAAFGHMTGPSPLLDCTYRFAPSGERDPFAAWQIGSDLRREIFAIWVGFVSVASVSHWLQVQLHVRSVRRYLAEFNAIAADEGFAPIRLRPVGIGLRPLWIIGAIIMILNSAPWAVPLVLAGAVQRRYTRHSAQDFRTHLAERARHMLLYRRPRTALPPEWLMRMRCATTGCKTPLPTGARFCPRCGTRAVPKLDRVA
jgi:hypothetical protein